MYMQQYVTMTILKCNSNNKNCDFAFIGTPNIQQGYVVQAYQPAGQPSQPAALQQEAVVTQAPSTVPSQQNPECPSPQQPQIPVAPAE